MNKRILTILLTSLALTALAQQQEDRSNFGTDFSASVEKSLTKRLDVSVDFNLRTQDVNSLERISGGASLGYRLVDTKRFNLDTQVGWEYIHQHILGSSKYTSKGNLKTVANYNRPRHRTSLAISGSYKPNKRWTLSLRETLQYNHYASAETTEKKYDKLFGPQGEYFDMEDPEIETKYFKAKDRFVLRSKLSVQYNIRKCPLAPYAAVDYGCGLNYTVNKWKLTAGTDIKFNKHHKLDVFYRYTTEDDDDEPNGHILGVGYKFKF